MATQPQYPLLTARDFLEIEFGDRKAELDNGVIRMMAGGTVRHSAVQSNILAWLRFALRGSGCRPHGPDMAVKTHDLSVRYPDVSVFCGRNDEVSDRITAFDDPRIVVEVLSAGTARSDLTIKLVEYRNLPSVDTIIYVDIATERVRVIQRTGAHGWTDVAHDAPFDTPLPALGITLPHDEMFARD